MSNLNIIEREGDLAGAIRVAREYESEKDVLEDRIRELEDVLEGKKKPLWEALAMAVSTWRVFPRIVIVFYIVMMANVIHHVLITPDVSVEVTALVGVITGAFAPILMGYMSTPRTSP